MFQELILVLAGYDSDLFDSTFQLRKNIPLLHPAERQLINEIAKVACIRREIQSCAEAYVCKLHPLNKQTVEYAEQILANFNEFLATIEMKIASKDSELIGTSFSLAQFLAQLSPWKLRLRALFDIVKRVLPCKITKEILEVLSESVKQAPSAAHLEISQALEIVLHKAWLSALLHYLIMGQRLDEFVIDFFHGNSESKNTYTSDCIFSEKLPHFLSSHSVHVLWMIMRSLEIGRTLVGIDFAGTCLKIHQISSSAISFPLTKDVMDAFLEKSYGIISRNIIFHLAPVKRLVQVADVLEALVLFGDQRFARVFAEKLRERIEGISSLPNAKQELEKTMASTFDYTILMLDLDERFGECVSLLKPVFIEYTNNEPAFSFQLIPWWPYSLFLTDELARVYEKLSVHLLSLQQSIIITKGMYAGVRNLDTDKTKWIGVWCVFRFLSTLQKYFYDGIIRPRFIHLKQFLTTNSTELNMHFFQKQHSDCIQYIQQMTFQNDPDVVQQLNIIYATVQQAKIATTEDWIRLQNVVQNCIGLMEAKLDAPDYDKVPMNTFLLQLT
ncbi:gamma tubulin complex subunit Gfh1 [Schizosaccharomyces japonicus yFS275]|uniref:Gamma tubulin complex subunit Gfh1 n=1 Tax=Schizosaccharomyces japonicus (strain yFS275 / FY16936) TaxID=402676 RepID=B6JWT0_SCHJY|nr:gamma tubulin complex subunit Gfh1 [Schizosaccharomyces japonicus yFS275]EEB05831.1 gamma tubulin complex subunit Gfh1 [Schizosaccharomyces japonicus yFS275]